MSVSSARDGDMRHFTGLILAVALLGGCSDEAEPAPAEKARGIVQAPPATPPAKPDLSACPKAEPVEEQIRTGPIPVPQAFEGVAASSMDHFAFTTLEGSTICVDTTWLETVDDAELTDNGRFASFAWVGYEAYGYVIVDRTGKGQVIDTGNAPVRSPSGHRFASVELTESGFGSLNAFAVWDIRPAGLRQVAEVSEGLPGGDWRLEGWQGDSCVRLSNVPLERQPEDYRDMDKTARDPWFAAEANRWTPTPGSCPRP